MRIDVTAILAGLGAAAIPYAAAIGAGQLTTVPNLVEGRPPETRPIFKGCDGEVREGLMFAGIGAAALASGVLLAATKQGALKGVGYGLAIGSAMPFLMGAWIASHPFDGMFGTPRCP